MIVDGRRIAEELLAEIHAEVGTLGIVPVVRAITVSPNAATESYLRIKERQARQAGMQLEVVRLQEDVGTDEVIHAVVSEGAGAVLVQLPLPESIDTKAVLESIPLNKDADILTERARMTGLLPPVVGAVKEILERSGISVSGKTVVVLGRGWLVGEPIAKWLREGGAVVTTFDRDDFNPGQLKNADIIVSGVGQAGLVKKEYIKEGVVLIDAGTSESGGAIAGDIDTGCASVASIFTPVPGGVGPVAVACLFKNVFTLHTTADCG